MNGVAVGEQTYRATSQVFEYEPLDAGLGEGEGGAACALAGEGGPRPLRHATSPPHTTPFVGRELEKPLLIGTFERAAQQRSVQLVTIVGEPGVGKSRLVAELFAYIDAKPELIRWRQGRCLPYGEGITFWALGRDRQGGGGRSSSPIRQRSRRRSSRRRSPPRSPSGSGCCSGWRRSSASRRRRRPSGRSCSRPGAASSRVLPPPARACSCSRTCTGPTRRCSPSWSTWPSGREGVPLLVLCAARPELYERRPGWGAGQRNAHTINLSPLSDQETAELVSYLVTTTVLSARARAGDPRAGGRQPALCGGVRAPARGPRPRAGGDSWRRRRCPRACRR